MTSAACRGHLSLCPSRCGASTCVRRESTLVDVVGTAQWESVASFGTLPLMRVRRHPGCRDTAGVQWSHTHTIHLFSDCRPGMYTFVNVPSISKMEWHPFSEPLTSYHPPSHATCRACMSCAFGSVPRSPSGIVASGNSSLLSCGVL